MYRSGLACVALIALLLLMFTCSSALAVVYVKWDSPGPTLDGTSWATAYHKVRDGLNAASSGGEVWVAKGTYIENIELKDGVGLYGGFTGTETSRAQRDFRTNETVLDGSGRQDSTVNANAGVTAGAVIDGFTIRGGHSPASGGGIGCWNSSPTIANNIITENWAPSWGGGIYCLQGSPIITGNIIVANGGSGSGGIGCYDASPIITNNTIVSNSGHGIWSNAYSSPRITNNIVAFNTSGIYTETGPGTPIAQYNCVYGNARFDFSGSLNSYSNISSNPRLADSTYGNIHIQPDSPCINRGLNTALGLSSVDADGQQRVQGSTVDIGADESDGTVCSAGPYAVVRVSTLGNDANDGSSWTLAKQTVQAGIDAASAVGGEVWVRAGVYGGRITMHPYAHIYGGFAGTESTRAERDWVRNRCVIDGGANRATVTAQYIGYAVSSIDGFTIRNGERPYWGRGGGISCLSASPIIANNLITGNSSTTSGGGIGCAFGASPIIVNNTITGNTAPLGGGIGCEANSESWPTITNNSIFGNTATNGGGIYSTSSPAISNNIVAFNSGGGIYTTAGTPALRNNCVYGNAGYAYSGLSAGTGDISLDPLLFDPASGDAHLTSLSPCINAAWSLAPSLPAKDMDGNSRIIGGMPDIGANEYPGSWMPPSVSSCTFGPDGGVLIGPINVTIVCLTPGATIHYTINGIDPVESDPVYNNPVLVDSDLTLKARAYKTDWAPSTVKSASYTILPTVAPPTFDPGGGAYTSAQYVTISCTTPDATIHYTTNGEYPMEGDPVYSSPVLVDSDLILTATAWKTGWNSSNVATAVYILPVRTPTFSPDGGLYALAPNVTIDCATPGATIHYTTNGIDPAESDPVYTEPVPVGTNLTLKARGYKEGWPTSAVKSADYEIDPSVSVADIKMLPNESQVSIARALVSAAFSGYFYIQADYRSSGIRVDKSGHTFTAGIRVDVRGTIKTNSYGERYVLAATAAQSDPPGDTGTTDPLRLIAQCVGGTAWKYNAVTGAGQIGIDGNTHLNNIGLLVRTAGEVTYSPTGTYFVVSDGSKVTDLSGYRGVRVTVPTGITKPAVGKHVEVTGVSSLVKSGTHYYPIIRVRTQADILVLD